MGVFKSVNMYAVAVLWFAGCMIVKALVRAGKTCPNWQSYVISDMQQHQQRGIGLLGVDPEQIRLIDPIYVTGPFLDCGNIVTIREQGAAKKFLNRLFQILPFAYGIYLLVNQQYYIPELIFRMDGENARYSMITQHFFYFSEEQIFVYEVKYDLVNGRIYEENTYDYFYRDVDCIETGSTLREIREGSKIHTKSYEHFRIVVYSGTQTFAVTDGQEGILQNQVAAMRALLREKKNAD